MRENTVTVSIEIIQTTLVEAAEGDWSVLEESVRHASAGDVEADPERKAKLIGRAVNSRYLTKDARPLPEDEDTFIGALLQRYVEEIDTVEPGEQRRQEMIGKLALTIDGLRGLSWEELTCYLEVLPKQKTKNVYTSWSDAAAESAKLIRGDLGSGSFSYEIKRRAKADEDGSREESIFGRDVVEGFEDLRGTIIDLLHGQAPGMSPDIAAALIVGLGIDRPSRAVSAERLEAYKTNVLQWLSLKLAHTTKKPVVEDETESVTRGRLYLSQIASHYPVKERLSASKWLMKSYGASDADHARHVESHMAFALYDMFTNPQ